MTRNLPFAISAGPRLVIMSFNYLIRQQNYYCRILITFSSGALSFRERPHSPVSSLCENCNVMKSLKSIYFSLINLHIWKYYNNKCKPNFLNKKKLIRIMVKLNEYEFVKSYYGLFKMLTVIINNKSKINNHHQNTRNKNEMLINHHRLKMFKKKPTYIGTKLL